MMSNELQQMNKTEVIQPQNSAMATQIFDLAAQDGFDVEKLEKLMDLYERDTNRQAKVAFNQAFAEMQSDLPTVAKSKTVSFKKDSNDNPITAYKHATLEDIVDIVRPVLQQYGFAISFSIDTHEKVTVTCTLMHKAGHSIDTTITLNPDGSGSKNNVQAIGSSVSYGKRYTLCSLLNIATRDDDDAQSCAANRNLPLTTLQVKALKKRFDSLPDDRQKNFSDWISKEYNAENLAEIPSTAYNKVSAYLNKAVAGVA